MELLTRNSGKVFLFHGKKSLAFHLQDGLAEWSKALASGASPQGRGFEPHSYQVVREAPNAIATNTMDYTHERTHPHPHPQKQTHTHTHTHTHKPHTLHTTYTTHTTHYTPHTGTHKYIHTHTHKHTHAKPHNTSTSISSGSRSSTSTSSRHTQAQAQRHRDTETHKHRDTARQRNTSAHTQGIFDSAGTPGTTGGGNLSPHDGHAGGARTP